LQYLVEVLTREADAKESNLRLTYLHYKTLDSVRIKNGMG